MKYKSCNCISSHSSGYDYFSMWSLWEHHPILHFQAGCSENLSELSSFLCRDRLPPFSIKPRFVGQSFLPQKYISNVLDVPRGVSSVWKRGEITPSHNFFRHVGKYLWLTLPYPLYVTSMSGLHLAFSKALMPKSLTLHLICTSAAACPSFWPEDTSIGEG